MFCFYFIINRVITVVYLNYFNGLIQTTIYLNVPTPTNIFENILVKYIIGCGIYIEFNKINSVTQLIWKVELSVIVIFRITNVIS